MKILHYKNVIIAIRSSDITNISDDDIVNMYKERFTGKISRKKSQLLEKKSWKSV